MNNLRIIEAKIHGQIFPISLHEIESIPNNYITVIIGNNATGKSRLLTSMVNCLRQEASPKLRGRYEASELLIYTGDNITKITGDGTNYLDNINVISISNSLFDKFPHETKSDKTYSYVGARPDGLSSPKRLIINDLMDILSSHLEDATFRNKANTLFSFLKLNHFIDVSLKVQPNMANRAMHLFEANSSLQNLIKYLSTIADQGFYRQQSKKIKRIILNEKFMSGFHEYIKSDFQEFIYSKGGRLAHYFINLEKESENNDFLSEYKYFSLLRQLNIVTYDSITVQKSGIEYDITDSSTGEIGLLTTFLRAIPQLKPNSIVFIDEPEISLHPSWQMQYIELLNKFLEGYTGCHVIIATHSHLILSDLKNEWSSVLTLRTNNSNSVVARLKEHTPFGWSPEAILYEVFGVATVRNQYFEHELASMLKMISHDSDNIEKIQQYIDWFESFQYPEADPLNRVLNEAKRYVDSKR